MHTCYFFSQTDTASVLQETIGYIRFLLSQIEVIFLLFTHLSFLNHIYIQF
jgi:hypothetical protein